MTIELETYDAIKIDGGQVLINGNIVNIPTTTIVIPKDGVEATYNIIVDKDGALKLLRDNFFETEFLSTPSAEEIINGRDRVLLGQLDVSATNYITAYRDFRRFVNSIDDKFELLVEENTITNGSFASLAAAINYLNVHATGYSGSKVIKIRGIVEYTLTDGILTVPDGVIIEGENVGNITDKETSVSKLYLHDDGVLFSFGKNCTLKNLLIEHDAISGGPAACLIGDGLGLDDTTADLIGFRMEGCSILNTKADAIILARSVQDCVIENCYVELESTSPFYSLYNPSRTFFACNFSDNVRIYNNIIKPVSDADILSFIYSSTSSKNIWVKRNSISASGLLGNLFSCISLINSENAFICENIFEFTSVSKSTVKFMSGVIDLIGHADSCKINDNKIIYTNPLALATDIWVGNPISNESYYIGFAIGVNSPFDLVAFGATAGDMSVKNITIENNYINVIGISGILVGVANGAGSGVFVKNNVIENSYLVGFGIAIGNTKSGPAYEMPIITNVVIDGNYVKNSIQISDYSAYTDIVTAMYLPTGLITVGGVDYPSRGYYNGVVISNNILLNEYETMGIPHGIVVERCNNLCINNNNVKNCALVDVDSSLKSIALKVDGANVANINNNVLDTCNTGMLIEYNTINAIVFGSNISVENNYIVSVSGEDSIVEFNQIFGQSFFSKNALVNNSVRVHFLNYHNCSCDKNVVLNNFYSFATKTITKAIRISDSGGIYKTRIVENVFNIDSDISTNVIEFSNTGAIENVYIEKNIISGRHVTRSIYLFNSDTINYLHINDNIILNTNTSASSSMIYVAPSDGAFNVFLKNNIIVTVGTGIALSKIYLATIANNLVSSVAGSLSYAIGISNSDQISICDNILYNFKNSIYFNNSAYTPTVVGYIDISKNRLINTGIETDSMIKVLNVTLCDVIVNKNTISYIQNGSESITSMIHCENINTGRVLVESNDIFSLKEMTYVINCTNAAVAFAGITISNNSLYITSVTTAAISIHSNSSIVYPIVCNNIISATALKKTGILLDGDCLGVQLNNNFVFSAEATDISADSEGMIKMVATSTGSVDVSICNNMIGNGVSGKGVKNGICTYSPLYGLIMSGNLISKFDNNTPTVSKGISTSSLAYSIISNNIIAECTHGIYIYDTVDDLIISNNIVKSNKGKSALFMLDDSEVKSKINIVGNSFFNTGSIVYEPLVKIDNPNGERILISSNLFNSGHTPTSLYRLLYLNISKESFVISNLFTTNGAANFGVQPLYVTSGTSDCVCAFNNLRNVTNIVGAGKVVSVDGTDYMNWGQKYVYIIPYSGFQVPISALVGGPGLSSVSSWSCTVGLASGFIASDGTYYAGYEILSASIVAGNIPVGSKIDSIEVSYTTTATGSDLSKTRFGVIKKNAINGSIIAVCSFTDMSNTGSNIDTLTPANDQYILYTNEFQLLIQAVSGGSWETVITGAQVNYTL